MGGRADPNSTKAKFGEPSQSEWPTMRIGLLARATKTGLGHQCWEIWRHLNPAVTIVVDHAHPPESWYRDAPRIPWMPKQELPGAFVLLATCDVVLSVETFYDWTLPERLAAVDVPTVLIVNPELFDGHWTTVVWNPTSWMMRDEWADHSDWVHVPHPCPVDRYPGIKPLFDPFRVVHPTSVAMLDRNGSEIVRKAWRQGRWPHDNYGPLSQNRVDDYWERDGGYAASLIPRRYGGLCLPALEAFSAGTPVLMPAVSPNTDWPITSIPHADMGITRMKGGRIPLVNFDPYEVAETVSKFLTDRDRIEHQRTVVRVWAEAHSWEALLPLWRAELERTAGSLS